MNDTFLPITLHASEYPEARREALLASLRALELPGKLLYESPAQAQRWLDYHAAWSPSRTDAALRTLYGKAFRAAVEAVGDNPVLLVGVGSGGGSKDADLLHRLSDAAPERHLHYAPLDASGALVAEAALLARRRCKGVALHPLVADMAASPELEHWLEAIVPKARRIYTAFGVLPNLDVRTFPAWLAGLLRPGDVVLVSANLSPEGMTADGARILMQYDNVLARAWYVGALAELGVSARTFALDIAARPLAEGPALGLTNESAWQVAVRAALRETVSITLHGEALRFPSGRRLEVFHSHRFTADGGATLLEAAGLPVAERWVGAQGEEGIYLCRRG
ncbi:MAG TPA: L-histidine N(alpha)-methyltransferase [bacterium]|nr:L-histidine N(alpha)-methyltransferase [bacterium]